MDRHNNYEKELPKNYVLIKHVDAKSDKKIMVIYTLLSFVPLLVSIPIWVAIIQHGGHSIRKNIGDGNVSGIHFFVWVVLIVYLVLHELTHGIIYKFFTGAKLTFGLTLTVAFCGVPDIYVRKKASLVALIMPFFVFSIIFLTATVGLWSVSPLYGIMAGTIFAMHLGGCVGDLHWTLLYLTKFRNCNTLMRDIGPEQWLYIPREEAERYNILQLSLDT